MWDERNEDRDGGRSGVVGRGGGLPLRVREDERICELVGVDMAGSEVLEMKSGRGLGTRSRAFHQVLFTANTRPATT